MKVVISEFMDETALAAFDGGFALVYDPHLVDDRPRLFAELADADGLIVRNKTIVDTALLDAAPKLRVVGRHGVGLETIDLAACAARGIAVRPAVGANAVSVAEYVIAAALDLTRKSFNSNAAMIAGDWPRQQTIGGELAGKTFGILGLGSIGRIVAARAAALDVKLLACDPYVPADDLAWHGIERCDLPTLLAESDILTLHTPLTDETRGLFGAQTLAAMKPGAILINSARGHIIDEAALAASLSAAQLGGAAIDVFATEPLTAEAAQVFVGVPNLILTPHIAGVTIESNARVSRITVANVIEELSREPI